MTNSDLQLSNQCHVHFYNKDKVRIDGEIKPPITIDTHSVKSISIPLTQVKTLKCVILLVSKFVKQGVHGATSKFAYEVFRTPFLKDEGSNTDIFRFSAILFAVNFSTDRFIEIVSNWRQITLLFRLVGLVHFIEATKNRKPYTNNYIVCRYTGDQISPLVNVGLIKLMNITVGLQGLDSYYGNYFYMQNATKEILPFRSGNRISRKNGPARTAKDIFPHLHFTSFSIKALTEIYILEEILETINATIHFSSRNNEGYILNLEISHMEIRVSDEGPTIPEIIKGVYNFMIQAPP